MKTLILLPILLLTGCATVKLPDITAKDVRIIHRNPIFSADVTAENVVDHGTYVTADKLEYSRDGRFTSTTIIVKDYRRDKEPAKDASVP